MWHKSMKKTTTILLSLTFLTMAAFSLAVITPETPEPEMPSIQPIFVSQSIPVQGKPQGETPDVIVSPSCIGAVSFKHKYHIEEMEIECQQCHHETNAATLDFPHENYFEDFWIDCTICHHKNGETTLAAQSCSKCHHAQPAGIADETLSAKVVIHKSCWECHETGKGQEASANCKFCHTGEKAAHR